MGESVISRLSSTPLDSNTPRPFLGAAAVWPRQVLYYAKYHVDSKNARAGRT